MLTLHVHTVYKIFIHKILPHFFNNKTIKQNKLHHDEMNFICDSFSVCKIFSFHLVNTQDLVTYFRNMYIDFLQNNVTKVSENDIYLYQYL